MTITKPMLAGKCNDIHKLQYPVLATPKLDGIRCLIIERDGRPAAVSRNFKPIPNHHVRNWLEQNCPVGFDGELVVPGATFQGVSSAIMSRDGVPDFEYQVFDWVTAGLDECYGMRMTKLRKLCDGSLPAQTIKVVIPVLPEPIYGQEGLEDYEKECLADGYEGVMVRTPNSPYKCGRSTEREGFLLKIKRFTDAEAMIVGVEEKLHNANEAKKDAFGYTERSSHKANMVPMDTLGALIVKDLATGIQFNIGTGFDDATRDLLWKARRTLNGKIVKYKSQPHGVKDAPRFPVYLGLRSRLEER